MKAYILLGGLGTRLRPLTNIIPKPLLPLDGKPFLWYQLKLIETHNIREVFLGLGYQSHRFQDELRNLGFKNLGLTTVIEDKPLGTGGALALAAPVLNETTFVFNGDVLTNLNLSKMLAFHRQRGASATMAVTLVSDPRRYGLVIAADDGKINQFREKSSGKMKKAWINAGVYIFEPRILSLIPKGKNYSLEKGLFPLLVKQNEPFFAYRHKGYWLDIGTVFAYEQAKTDIKSGLLGFCKKV